MCIVDTGINGTIPEFGSRASFGANLVNDRNYDENGHGTFVASIIAGTRFGVAKKANVIGVKVLDASGAGSLSKVISGINWCVENARQRGAVSKTVMNLSLGGSYSRAVNEATENAVRAGLFVAAAVGGSNVSADTYNSRDITFIFPNYTNLQTDPYPYKFRRTRETTLRHPRKASAPSLQAL